MRAAAYALIAAGAAALVTCAPARAQQAALRFHLAAGPAAQTLPEFGKQAGLLVLAMSNDLAGASTNEVAGDYTPAEALRRLVDGTGLAAQLRDNGTVLVAPVAAPADPAAAGDGAARAVAGEGILRLDAVTAAGIDWNQADFDRVFADIPKIVVSIRRAQQSGIERKKAAPTAMDSIVADDVGTLPDRNIGEAISRIAGVAVSRGEFGEGVSVGIRGNGTELARVELDGQGVRSAGGSDMNGGGDGRATEFRQLSADLIRSVDVIKGATADMTEGSLGGSVIIKTRSALEFNQPYAAVRIAGSQNSLNRKWDPDANLVATRKFLDGRLGVLVNASASTLSNESHQFQVSANGQDGYMRAIDFDNSPQKTFTYRPETVDLADPATAVPWASYGAWSASTPLDIVLKSAAAQTKADCYAAFPVLGTGSGALSGLSSANKTNAINARNLELASCLNQWNDDNPALLRYTVKRQVDRRRNLDLRTDFRADRTLSVYAKASFSRREVDDNVLNYTLGNISVNGSNPYVDAGGVRTAVPGGGAFTFPYAYSLASGQAPLRGAVANIDPASVVVDASHHLIQYTLQNASVTDDQTRNRMGTTTRYLQAGGEWRGGPLALEFMGGDMASRFWRGDERTTFSYVYGNPTVALQPNGIWAYTIPEGANLNDWGRVAALQPAAAAGQPQYTAVTAGINYTPQLRESAERTAKLDLTLALPPAVPFLRQLKAGVNLRDSGSGYWNTGGYTVSPATAAAPAVTVPGNKLTSTFVGCLDTAGSLAPGGTRCAYGVNGSATSRNYQIVLTPRQFQDAILGAMAGPATPTSLFQGASGRPDALIDNWTQIDVARVFATVGARNLDFSCMKTCTGSDGKVYEQPKSGVRERSQAAYLRADFAIDRIPYTDRQLPFGWELEGNLGWRAVRTSVGGTGAMTFVSKLRTAAFDPANPGAAAGFTTSQVTLNTTVRAVAHDFLPIQNLALWLVPGQLVVRYNHARAVARPPASLLVASGSCTYDETRLDAGGNPASDMTCGTVGNPALRARVNLNQNLSAEWYPDKDTMFTVAAYKQVGKVGAPVAENLVGAKVFAGTDTVDPASGRSLADIPFDVRAYVNGPPATRTGVEFSARTAFTFLPWLLRHTGFDANVTRQHSNQARLLLDLLSGEALAPRGEPRYSFNWALWYDDGKWQARVAAQVVGAKFSCIAPCGDSPVGYTLNAYPNAALGWKNPAYNPGSPNITDRTSYVDGKISYRFGKRLDIFVEGRNLTNQTQTTSIASAPYADGTPNLQNYYYPGRRITIGLNFRNL